MTGMRVWFVCALSCRVRRGRVFNGAPFDSVFICVMVLLVCAKRLSIPHSVAGVCAKGHED